jgi:glycosyltransferase involved in cell wall biosynthesis
VGDAADIVEDTGVVVAPEDPEALASAINAVLLERPEQRISAGRRARELISRKHNLQDAADLYRGLWHRPGEPIVVTPSLRDASVELSESFATV